MLSITIKYEARNYLILHKPKQINKRRPYNPNSSTSFMKHPLLGTAQKNF